MKVYKRLSSSVRAWDYIAYAGAASAITAVKSYLYSHLLIDVDYAVVNYFLLIVGVGVLVAGAGVIIRCHVELPVVMVNKLDAALEDFLSEARSVAIFCCCAVLGGLFFITYIGTISLSLACLSFFQIFLYLMFTIDLLVIKSSGDFTGYARKFFVRNGLITMAGVISAYVWSTANAAIFAEVGACVLICLRYFKGWFSSLKIPSYKFCITSLKFAPVTILGALLQYVDRIAAAALMSANQFSIFSYLFLLVMAGLSVQQLINTKIITILAVRCVDNSRLAFFYMLKTTLVVACVLVSGLTAMLLLIKSDFFVANWVRADTEVGVVFVLCAVLRGADFSSAYLVSIGYKKILMSAQMISLVIFSLLSSYYYSLAAEKSLNMFMWLMLFGFFCSFVLCNSLAWRASRVETYRA